MFILIWFTLFYFSTYLIVIVECYVPLVPAILGIASTIGTYWYKDAIQCTIECCHDQTNNKWINYNTNFKSLKRNIFGQQIALNIVTSTVRQHLKNKNPPKALVLSFNGYTGIGKNHLSKLIAKAIYTKYDQTENSKFVHTLVATHFLSHDINEDQDRLKKFIETSIYTCERSLFIIDEIDKFPGKFLDVLIPYMESNHKINGLSFNKAIFFLLGSVINLHV